MQVVRRKRETRRVVGELGNLYPHDVQLYTLPPISTISLSEFEEYALERLKVLRIIERANLKGVAKYSDDWASTIKNEMMSQGLKAYHKLCFGGGKGMGDSEQAYAIRKRDHISHYLLRLVYCRSEDLRRWFISRELDLFRLKFHEMSQDAVKEFLEINKLDYSPIPNEEKESLMDKFYNSTPVVLRSKLETQNYYKVPFLHVLDLVRTRKVYLKSGYAYIPDSDFVCVLVSIFRSEMARALVVTCRSLPNMEEDERLVKVLRDMDSRYTGQDYSKNVDRAAVQIENLDHLSRSSYPLCMRQLHEKLREIHHLRHGGRMQYGLFLKAIGLTLEDAMKFWRSEFTKAMDVDKFEKQHSYNIRHNYGQEGKRVNYTPYSCMKIIGGSVGAGDYHGCPFRHNDAQILRQQLLRYHLSQGAIEEVMDYVKRGHFQLACQKYFEITHKSTPDSGINHPNQYFDESQKILTGKAPPKPKAVYKTESVPISQPGPKENLEDMWLGDDFDLQAIEDGIKDNKNN